MRKGSIQYILLGLLGIAALVGASFYAMKTTEKTQAPVQLQQIPLVGISTPASPAFPTSLNNFQDGDVINSGDWNAIENTIGVTGSNATSSLTYKLTNASSTSPGHKHSGSDIATGTVSVSNGGTGTSTLTANSLLVGNGTSSVSFIPPGTSGYILTSNGSSWSSSPIPTSTTQFAINSTFTAGDTLATGTAVWISEPSTTEIIASQETATSSTDNFSQLGAQCWQTFTAHGSQLASTTLWFAASGGIQTYTLCTFGSVASPCASTVATTTTSLAGATGAQTINWGVTVTPNTRYVIGIRDNQNAGQIAGSATSSILLTGEVAIYNNATSTNVGTWYIIPYENNVNGVFKTTTSNGGVNKSYRYNNFIGFSSASYNVGSTATIQTIGNAQYFSSLVTGKQYYLQDTAGTIGTSAGTNSFKIGRALSTTTLKIISQNP